jgi:hypothetical protein
MGAPVNRVSSFNEKIAIWGTRGFTSIWAFYAFFLWGALGLVPGLPAGFTNIVLLVSSAFIQLWALPLIAVGAAVLNRASEHRAKADHEMLRKEFAIQNAELARLEKIDTSLDRIQVQELKEIKGLLIQVLAKLEAAEAAPIQPGG